MTPDDDKKAILQSWANRMTDRLRMPRVTVEIYHGPACCAAAWTFLGASAVWFNSARWQPGTMTGPVGYNVMTHEISHVCDEHLHRNRDPAKSPWQRHFHDELFWAIDRYCARALGRFDISREARAAAYVPVDPAALVYRPGQRRPPTNSGLEFDPDDTRPTMPRERAIRLVACLAIFWRWRDMHQAAQAA